MKAVRIEAIHDLTSEAFLDLLQELKQLLEDTFRTNEFVP